MKEQHPSSSIGSTSPSQIKKSIRKSFPRLPQLSRAFQARIVGVVSASALVLLASACGDSSTLPGQSETNVLRGNITIEGSREALSHIPSSRVVVQLEDVSLQDASSVVIAEQVYEGVTTLPLTYELTWVGELDPQADYSVAARVYDEAGELIYVTDTIFPVFPGDTNVDFHIISVYIN